MAVRIQVNSFLFVISSIQLICKYIFFLQFPNVESFFHPFHILLVIDEKFLSIRIKKSYELTLGNDDGMKQKDCELISIIFLCCFSYPTSDLCECWIFRINSQKKYFSRRRMRMKTFFRLFSFMQSSAKIRFFLLLFYTAEEFIATKDTQQWVQELFSSFSSSSQKCSRFLLHKSTINSTETCERKNIFLDFRCFSLEICLLCIAKMPFDFPRAKKRTLNEIVWVCWTNFVYKCTYKNKNEAKRTQNSRNKGSEALNFGAHKKGGIRVVGWASLYVYINIFRGLTLRQIMVEEKIHFLRRWRFSFFMSTYGKCSLFYT